MINTQLLNRLLPISTFTKITSPVWKASTSKGSLCYPDIANPLVVQNHGSQAIRQVSLVITLEPWPLLSLLSGHQKGTNKYVSLAPLISSSRSSTKLIPNFLFWDCSLFPYHTYSFQTHCTIYLYSLLSVSFLSPQLQKNLHQRK